MKQFSQEYLDYINGPIWAKQRLKAFQKWGRKCCACGAQRDLDVHHLAYRNLTDVTSDDLMPLCRTHHELTHALPDLIRLLSECNTSNDKRAVITGYFSPQSARTTPQTRHASRLERRTRQKRKEQAFAARAKKHADMIVAAKARGLQEKRERVQRLGLMSKEMADSASTKALRRVLQKRSKKKRDDRNSIREALLTQIRSNPSAVHYIA